MRRLTGWVIGGLVAMALWVPGAGAQDGRQMYQGMRHDWREIHQDRQDIRRDWRDIQRDHYRIWQDRRAAFWRHRAQLRADRRALWHDWRHMRRDYYNRW
jgi:hypothetical protein